MNSVTLGSLIAAKLGVGTTTRVNPELSQVGVTSTQVFRQNPNRLALIFTNLSANDIYIAPLDAASPSRGILVSPSGGSFALIWDEDFDMVGFQWNAIAAAANSNVFGMEILAQAPGRGK